MSQCMWSLGDQGAITTDRGQYRLAVVTVGGFARWLVSRKRPSPEEARGEASEAELLASGTQSNVTSAMLAAEARADRMLKCRTNSSEP